MSNKISDKNHIRAFFYHLRGEYQPNGVYHTVNLVQSMLAVFGIFILIIVFLNLLSVAQAQNENTGFCVPAVFLGLMLAFSLIPLATVQKIIKPTRLIISDGSVKLERGKNNQIVFEIPIESISSITCYIPLKRPWERNLAIYSSVSNEQIPAFEFNRNFQRKVKALLRNNGYKDY